MISASFIVYTIVVLVIIVSIIVSQRVWNVNGGSTFMGFGLGQFQRITSNLEGIFRSLSQYVMKVVYES